MYSYRDSCSLFDLVLFFLILYLFYKPCFFKNVFLSLNSCDHCSEHVLWVGAVRRGFHAEQQPDDGGGLPHRLFRRHPLLHHVCRHEQVRTTFQNQT